MATAALSLPQDHVKAIDTLRSRLAQLSTSITLLKQQLELSETLPPWPALQQNAASVEYNLRKVGETMTAHRQIFSAAHAYPLPTFPGTTQEHVLQMLLRKKLEPRAEDWIEEALKIASASEQQETSKLRSLWNWAGPLASGIARELEEADVFKDNFTIAERADGVENVVTGIRRNLDDEDEEDDDEDAQDGQRRNGHGQPDKSVSVAAQHMPAPLPLASLLAFMSSGDLPKPVR